MGAHLIPVPFALIGIAIYWQARWTNDIATVMVVQPLITILCIATALLSLRRAGVNRRLPAFVTAGLAIALLGDFLNIDMTDPFAVMRGLVIAVIAYLTYAVGFTIYQEYIDRFENELTRYVSEHLQLEQIRTPLFVNFELELYDSNDILMEWI